MKKVIVFLMFAMTVLIAASNAVPERIAAPDVDVGYVIDIQSHVDIQAILSENTVFTIETIGDRQEGVTDVTIRSGPMTVENLPFYTYTWFRYKCDYAIIPAIVFRV